MSTALKEFLGHDIHELDKLDAAAQQQLLADMTAAKHTHEKHLYKAMEDALGHLPWIIRTPVKKLFGL